MWAPEAGGTTSPCHTSVHRQAGTVGAAGSRVPGTGCSHLLCHISLEGTGHTPFLLVTPSPRELVITDSLASYHLQ